MKTKMNTGKLASVLGGVFILVVAVTACSPVNFLTKAKKVPREYQMNYDVKETKSPKKFRWNQDPWIVFSDKSDNKTYTRPGGRIVLKEVGFMEPLVVIKRKKDYIRVVKYTKEILKEGKLTNRKAVEYMGWIPLSDVVLSRNAVTNVRNSQHSKFVTAINGQDPLLSPNVFISTDSIRIFSEHSLIQEREKCTFSSVVYKMKESPDGKKSLVSKEPYLAADSAQKQIIGWVGNSLLGEAGQQYFIGSSSGRNDYRNGILTHNPVNYYCYQDSVRKIQTGLYRPALDYSDNFVLNVDGHKISYTDYRQIGNDLSKVNLIFVFEGEKQVITRFPQLVNTIQNLQERTKDQGRGITYSFSAVMGFQKDKKQFVHIPQESNFQSFMDSLYSVTDRINEYKPMLPSIESSALTETLKMLENKKNETNLIVLVGETGYKDEKSNAFLAEQMAEYNCRLLGFQLYGGDLDTYNNFVLHVQSMIDGYAELISVKKRRLLVSTEQLRSDSQYKEYSRNMYGLDFPKSSMTQGWVIFPGKKQTLELNALSAGIDTLLTQVEQDNHSVMNYLSSSFLQAGNYRSRFDSLMTCYYAMKENPRQQRVFANSFEHQSPVWYSNSNIWDIPDSLLNGFEHYLLVNVRELKQVLKFIKDISATQVDIDMRNSNSTQGERKNRCDCPEPIQTERYIAGSDTLSEVKYRSTRKIRKRLVRYYLRTVNENNVCRLSRKELNRRSLAWIHEYILNCPADNPLLSAIPLRDIKKKKRLTDKELNQLLSYYLQKKESFELNISNLANFMSCGQNYYWIDRAKLP